jgi:hypothetical protein
VSLTLSPFGPRRGWVGQITVHGQLAARAMESTTCYTRVGSAYMRST